MIISLVLLISMEFKFLGGRAISMGGAYTAIAEGTYGTYWNPAGIVYEKGFEIGFSNGFDVNATKNILGNVNDITNLSEEIQKIQNYSSTSAFNFDNYKYLLQAMKELNDLNEPGSGVIGSANGVGYGRFGKLSFNIYTIVDVGADPFIDIVNFSLIPQGSTSTTQGFDGYDPGYSTSTVPHGVDQNKINQAAQAVQTLASLFGLEISGTNAQGALIAVINYSTANGITPDQINSTLDSIINNYNAIAPFLPSSGGKSIAENETSLTITGAQSIVGSITYGRKITPKLAVGASLNLIRAAVAYEKIFLFEEDEIDINDIISRFNKSLTSSSIRPDFDIGFIYEVLKNLRTGLVIKNILNPSFDAPSGGMNYSFGRKIRTGVYWKPLNWIGVASDLDITRNETIISDYKSQIFSIGAEVNLFNRRYLNFGIRCGLFRNVLEAEGLNYAGGIGLRLGFLFLDAGGFISQKRVRTSTKDELPQYVGANINFGLRF